MRNTSGTPLNEETVLPVLGPFRKVNQRLLELLRDLDSDDWAKPTAIPTRDVKDLAAHLLQGSLGRVTSLRDGYRRSTPPINDYKSLVDFIQLCNREFMTGMKRVSSEIITELIAIYDEKVVALFEAADPHEQGLGVAWAGENVSKNWFDIAREYTEKWHHQQQIRDATSHPPLYDEELFTPVLETFARGLPFAFRKLNLLPGYRVFVETSGAVNCGWTLVRGNDSWTLWQGKIESANTTVSIPADVAWRVWTKSMGRVDAKAKIHFSGEESVADAVVSFVAIMA